MAWPAQPAQGGPQKSGPQVHPHATSTQMQCSLAAYSHPSLEDAALFPLFCIVCSPHRVRLVEGSFSYWGVIWAESFEHVQHSRDAP